MFRQYATSFDGFRVDLEEVIHADDERVVVELRDGGRMKGSDAEIWNRYFDVWTFRDGKAVRMSAHTDRARALERDLCSAVTAEIGEREAADESSGHSSFRGAP